MYTNMCTIICEPLVCYSYKDSIKSFGWSQRRFSFNNMTDLNTLIQYVFFVPNNLKSKCFHAYVLSSSYALLLHSRPEGALQLNSPCSPLTGTQSRTVDIKQCSTHGTALLVGCSKQISKVLPAIGYLFQWGKNPLTICYAGGVSLFA